MDWMCNICERFNFPLPVQWTAEFFQPALTQQARMRISACFHKAGIWDPCSQVSTLQVSKLMCSDPQMTSLKDLSTVTATETSGKEGVQLSGLAKELLRKSSVELRCFFLVRTYLLVSLQPLPAQTLGWARWCRRRWQLARGICTRGRAAGPARWRRCCGRWWGLSICCPPSSRSPRCRTARRCRRRRRSRTRRAWGRSSGCPTHKECRQVGLVYLQKRTQRTLWGSHRTSAGSSWPFSFHSIALLHSYH